MANRGWKRALALCGHSLVALLMFDGVCEAAASPGSLREVFLAEYPRAFRELEQFYTGCRLQARQRRILEFDRSEVIHSLDFSMNGKLYQVTATPISGFPESAIGEATKLLVSPSGGYELTKFPRSDSWVVARGVISSEIVDAVREDVLPVFAPFCIEGQRIVDLMAEPGFSVEEVSKVVRDGRPCVRVSWEGISLDKIAGECRKYGWILFDPENSWAVLESDRAIGTDDQPCIYSSRVVVEYQDKKSDGFPVTAKVTFLKEREAAREKSSEKIYDEITLVPTETPASEFTLAWHGIEGLSPRSSRLRTGMVIVSIIGVLLLVAALVLRRLGQQRSSA